MLNCANLCHILPEQKWQNKKEKVLKTVAALGLFGLVGEDGFEPSKRYAADLQAVTKWLFATVFRILTTSLTTLR